MDIMAGGATISANNSSHEIQGLSFASNHGTGGPTFAVNLQDHDHLGVSKTIVNIGHMFCVFGMHASSTSSIDYRPFWGFTTLSGFLRNDV